MIFVSDFSTRAELDQAAALAEIDGTGMTDAQLLEAIQDWIEAGDECEPV